MSAKKFLTVLLGVCALGACEPQIMGYDESFPDDDSDDFNYESRAKSAPVQKATTDAPQDLQQQYKSDAAPAAAAGAISGADQAGGVNTLSLECGPQYIIGNSYKIDGTEYTPTNGVGYVQKGKIGVIPPSIAGAPTANGEKFDPYMLTATSKTLPLPSIVKITNGSNGKSVVVRVNDRGPFINGRISDISPAAAAKIDLNDFADATIEILPTESEAVRCGRDDALYSAGKTIHEAGALAAQSGNPELYGDRANFRRADADTKIIDAPKPLMEDKVGAISGENQQKPETVVVNKFATQDGSGEGSQKTWTADSTITEAFQVQAGAYWTKDAAESIVPKVRHLGDTRVIYDANDKMYKIRIMNVNRRDVPNMIKRVNDSVGEEGGLIYKGRWTDPSKFQM